jgi:hypothetical protein
MAFDIVAGDWLIMNSVEYPIRRVLAYTDDYDPSFALEATVDATTKRSADGTAAAATNLTELKVTPKQPIASGESDEATLVQRVGWTVYLRDSAGYVELTILDPKT